MVDSQLRFGNLIRHLLHNSQKVNINLLSENDIEVYEVGEDLIIVIYVSMAKREQKPVFINKDMFGGAFRRDHTGIITAQDFK